jgi:CheY-like chemotaxis protein
MHPHGYSLLVVEDHADIRAIVRLALERAGYLVRCVGTGSAALQALATSTYALLLTDLHLPDMDGTTLIRQAQRGSTGLPVVMMSGSPWDEHLDQEAALHAVAFLAKPFAIDDLLTTVAQVLTAQRVAA